MRKKRQLNLDIYEKQLNYAQSRLVHSIVEDTEKKCLVHVVGLVAGSDSYFRVSDVRKEGMSEPRKIHYKNLNLRCTSLGYTEVDGNAVFLFVKARRGCYVQGFSACFHRGNVGCFSEKHKFLATSPYYWKMPYFNKYRDFKNSLEILENPKVESAALSKNFSLQDNGVLNFKGMKVGIVNLENGKTKISPVFKFLENTFKKETGAKVIS